MTSNLPIYDQNTDPQLGLSTLAGYDNPLVTVEIDKWYMHAKATVCQYAKFAAVPT